MSVKGFFASIGMLIGLIFILIGGGCALFWINMMPRNHGNGFPNLVSVLTDPNTLMAVLIIGVPCFIFIALGMTIFKHCKRKIFGISAGVQLKSIRTPSMWLKMAFVYLASGAAFFCFCNMLFTILRLLSGENMKTLDIVLMIAMPNLALAAYVVNKKVREQEYEIHQAHLRSLAQTEIQEHAQDSSHL